MARIDFDNVKNKLVTDAIRFINMQFNGFIVTELDLCKYNTLNILSHFSNIYDEVLNNVQKEKVNNIYNVLL